MDTKMDGYQIGLDMANHEERLKKVEDFIEQMMEEPSKEELEKAEKELTP